jgi:two-component system chemotaxis response regulator CheB
VEKNIMIIDDSALMRRVLSDIIEKDSRFRVSQVCRNGNEAYEKIRENRDAYDVILLDFFMPDMNADQLLVKLAPLNIKSKVIILSGVIKEDAMEIIHALEHGAFDFVMKPENFALAKGKHFEEKLLKRLELATAECDRPKVVVSTPVKKEQPEKRMPISINSQQKQKGEERVRGDKLIALACSTGGPKALNQVIPLLPQKLDAPMVIVQHMPQGFTKSLAERLDEVSKVHVKEAEDGDVLKKGNVYIAKGGCQLRVEKSRGQYILRVTDEPARNGLRPCADIMYESLVGSDFGEIVCVVLTGMGGDGTKGITKLNVKNKIYSITQTAETCTVYGMPKVFYESGLADEVVPLDCVADAIGKHVGVQ